MPAARRRPWLRWIAALWMTIQVAGVSASLAAPAPDCGCTMASCPMHHPHARPGDVAKCHLFDAHQPSSSALAFLFGPAAPPPAGVIVAPMIAGRRVDGLTRLAFARPLDPPTPPPR